MCSGGRGFPIIEASGILTSKDQEKMSGKKSLLFPVLLLLLILFPGMNYDGLSADEGGLRVYVKMTRVSFGSDESIPVEICVQNRGNERKSFSLYGDLYTTFQPVVYDNLGREAEIIVPHRLMNRDDGDVLRLKPARIIELDGGETFVQRIDLRKFYRFDSREYRVRIFFFPDAADRRESVSSHNMMTFTVRKPYSPSRWVADRRKTPAITPSEIVRLFLTAERNREWENHIKYINLQKYINSYPKFVKKYNDPLNDFGEREKIEQEFIEYLKHQRRDYLMDFKIANETILRDSVTDDPTNAIVKVFVKRFGARKPFVYRYTYKLEKTGMSSDYWKITDVDASVIKGKMP